MAEQQPDKVTQPTQPKNATRIRHVRFVTRGLIVSSPREALDALPARGAESTDKSAPALAAGYDIWLIKDEGRFKFERYDGGKLVATKYMDRSRIDVYEEW